MEAGKGRSSKRATWDFPDAADRRDFDLHRPDEQHLAKFMWKNTRKGHDTTAATMNFAVRYIGENAAVLAQPRSEHEEVLKGKLAGERLTWDDCKSMTLTNDVITETLRLCNISSSVSRNSLEDVHVGGQVNPQRLACDAILQNHSSRSCNLPRSLEIQPLAFSNIFSKTSDRAQAFFKFREIFESHYHTNRKQG